MAPYSYGNVVLARIAMAYIIMAHVVRAVLPEKPGCGFSRLSKLPSAFLNKILLPEIAQSVLWSWFTLRLCVFLICGLPVIEKREGVAFIFLFLYFLLPVIEKREGVASIFIFLFLYFYCPFSRNERGSHFRQAACFWWTLVFGLRFVVQSRVGLAFFWGKKLGSRFSGENHPYVPYSCSQAYVECQESWHIWLWRM